MHIDIDIDIRISLVYMDYTSNFLYVSRVSSSTLSTAVPDVKPSSVTQHKCRANATRAKATHRLGHNTRYTSNKILVEVCPASFGIVESTYPTNVPCIMPTLHGYQKQAAACNNIHMRQVSEVKQISLHCSLCPQGY